MAKKLLEVNTFSGGLNSYADARDIKDNEFAQNWNAVVDKSGIIRGGGMAVENIAADFHGNSNFQQGYGLFQFSSDYSISDIVGSTFGTGITTGTLAASGSTTAHSLENNSSVSGTDDYYNGMIMFIYGGTRIGESRIITDYDYTGGASERLVTTEAFGGNLSTSSKYIIYPWKLDGTLWSGKDEVAKKDFITNGVSTSMYTDVELPSSEYSGLDNYFIFSKDAAADDASVNLGYIEYGSTLKLIPGLEYNLSFDCSADDKWYNIISDGSEDGSGTTHGEKPAWVQLYSTDVEDSTACIRTISDSTPTTGEGNLSAAWETSQEHYYVSQTSTSGSGTGAQFCIKTDGSGNPTFHFTEHRGSGYVASDTLIFTDPGSTSNTATITVATINHVGLTLQTNSNWLSATNNSNYITNVNSNYIDNGDFADGVPDADSDGTDAVAWKLSDACTATNFFIEEVGASRTAAAMKYDGHDGSCYMELASFDFNQDLYMYQTITLDDMTHYHINFMYSSNSIGTLQFAIYDKTEEVFIRPWVGGVVPNTTSYNYDTLPTDAVIEYKYAGWEPSTLSENNNYAMNYKSLYVSKAQTGTTKNIEIRFRPAGPMSGIDYGAFLTGVTVFKAHNDLTTLSYNTGANNPFFDGVKQLSKYSMNFTVPQNYSEVSTWVLRLHAGQHGYRASNTIGNTASKSVHFDNINIVSSDENSDTITLLTDNRSDGSTIHLYSNYAGFWLDNKIKWSGINSQPNFNYINGMLKISDGNFKNNNPNKLMYYSKNDTSYSDADAGWLVKDYSIPTPPSISIYTVNEGLESVNVFDAIPYLNNYFKGLNRLSQYPATDGVVTRNAGYDLGWKMDVFGPGNLPYSHGLLIRYYGDEDSLAQAGGTWNSSSYSDAHNWNVGTAEQLYKMDTDWFYNNILDEEGNAPPLANHYASTRTNNILGAPSNYYNNADIIQSYGHKPETYWPSENDVDGGYGHSKQHMLIHYENFENGDIDVEGFSSLVPSGTYIRRIELEIRYNQRGRIHIHAPLVGSALPYFIVKSGHSANTSFYNNYGTAKVYLQRGIFGNVSPLDYYLDPRPNFHKVGYNGRNMNIELLEDGAQYDDYDRINAVIGYTQNLSRYHMDFDATFNYDQMYEPNTVRVEDEFFVELQEVVSDPDHPLFAEDWGAQSGHDSIYPTGGTTVPMGSESIYPVHAPDAHMWATFFINKFNIYFYDDEWINETSGENSSASNEVKINYAFGTPEISSLGWGGRTYKAAVSCVNIFDEESSLNITNGDIGKNALGKLFIIEGDAPSVDLRLGNTVLNDLFIKKTKIYMQSSESEIWYLQFYIDHKTKKIHSTTSNYSQIGSVSGSNYSTLFNIDRNDLKDFNEVSSYESETMVSQDDGIVLNNGNLTCRYKTSVIANNRLYVGNIHHNGRAYEDRMLKSPIGKYNILPQSNFIDVAINDGDVITALAYYKDKILQFKKNKVFVINISGDYEFLEDTFSNVGVPQSCSVTTTPHGIAWANKKGCYIYNGEKLENLIDNKIAYNSSSSTISNNYWITSIDSTAYNNISAISYAETEDILLVKFATNDVSSPVIPEGATYHFATKSWSFIVRAFNGQTLTNSSYTGDISNMITGINGEILFYQYKSGSYNRIMKWNHSSLAHSTASDGSADNVNQYVFSTKDFTFGNIAVRKKLYKVYITYKSNESDTNITVKGSVNGVNSFGILFSTDSKFKDGTACYTGSSLQGTSDTWKTAELKFATPSEVNKVYSFQLQVATDGSATTGDFEINDISISYRVKSVK